MTTIGPDGRHYACVIDISQHQGAVDFHKMKAAGCDKVILRTNHSIIVDARCRTYYADALAAGIAPHNIGFYTFVNPKRASAREAAAWFVDTVEWIGAPDDSLLMLDVESYQNESPNVGTIWPASQYAPWLRQHLDAVIEFAPRATIIGYSNSSFWDSRVKDPELAKRLEWIVPRYPVYNANGYLLHPLPSTDQWASWAFSRSSAGPFPPAGVSWDGWQFSAGFNKQGSRYGCSSSDLDLNIVTMEAWERWTRADTPPPPPNKEKKMLAILYTVRSESDPVNVYSWFYVSPEKIVDQVRNGEEYQDWKLAGAIERPVQSTGHFREMLTTYQPRGELGTAGKAVLGEAMTAWWYAKANPASGGSGDQWGMRGTVDLNSQTIDLDPK